jgi:hypothetical protein
MNATALAEICLFLDLCVSLEELRCNESRGHKQRNIRQPEALLDRQPMLAGVEEQSNEHAHGYSYRQVRSYC